MKKEKKSGLLGFQADPIDGPCNLVNKILDEGKVVKIDDLVVMKEFSHNCFIVAQDNKKKKKEKKAEEEEDKEETKTKEAKTILFI